MRKIEHVGLQFQYKYNTDQLKIFVCRISALSLVPICFVHLTWQEVKADTPELPRIDEFVTYLKATWIAGTFHTAKSNLYKTERPQTTNRLEGWYSCYGE